MVVWFIAWQRTRQRPNILFADWLKALTAEKVDIMLNGLFQNVLKNVNLDC